MRACTHTRFRPPRVPNAYPAIVAIAAFRAPCTLAVVSNSSRWLWGAVAAGVLVLTGCGSAGVGGSAFVETSDGGVGPDDATVPVLLNDATIPSEASTCTPRTCALAGATCGPIGDGCGNVIQCGPCTAPSTCGGGGTPSVCGGTAACVPATCATLAVNCGTQGDGCGNTIDCGTCTAPETCGGGGTGSVCGGKAACVPLTACPVGMNCGAVGDGCGGLVPCGTGSCPAGTTCGGGGSGNVCGGLDVLPDGGIIDGGLDLCIPEDAGTACAGKNCGIESNGCGGTYSCGTCTAPETCGGGVGTPHSVCGGNAGCVPLTACPSTMNCGVIGDGCGGAVYCAPDGGACPSGELCGGGGQPNVCGAKNILSDGAVIDGGLSVCVPLTQAQACSDVGKNCGVVSDGCSGSYDCGACTAPQTCGGGGDAGAYGVCGGNSGCVPLTACPAGMNCGYYADGCGGVLTCSVDGGTCPSDESCGGGGQPNVCGALNVLPDGGLIDGGLNICTPIAQPVACSGIGCGETGDGCGDIYVCGTCSGLDTCGGGGVPFQCGHPACTPATACPSGVTCGTIGDGCGGTIACGTCTLPQTCGGGGTPSVCGSPTCTPITSCPTGLNCGPWADGCGGTITCGTGTCTPPETCGGGGTSSVCGSPACTALTVCPGGKNCGTWPDGCGGTITCGNDAGTCTPPQICGGGGIPSVCGDALPDGGECTGIACNQVACDSGTTSISGTVYDPAGNDPLYNVVVYVPQSLPQPFTHGPSCGSCGSLYTGNPLVATVTAANGTFKLDNVPVMANLPIVIQIGKWRRQMALTQTINQCVNNAITAPLLLPPQENAAPADAGAGPWQGPGTIDDLPEIAVSTGGADTMECLFRRIGISASEYTAGSGGTGHIHIFQGSSNSGAAPTMSGAPSSLGNLWNSYTDMTPYDIVVLSCEGEETIGTTTGGGLTAAERSTLFEYANNGGRVFASHYHYSWFNKTVPDAGSFGAENLATWTAGANAMNDQFSNLEVNTNVVTTYWDGGVFARGQALETFLSNTNALGSAANTLGPADGTGATELNIHAPKHNANVAATNTASQPWLVADTNASSPGATEYFSFDTPVGGGDGGADYCGRVVYSDLHVGSAVSPADYKEPDGGTNNTKTPTYCTSTKLSPQEKALEFMLFDLSSCVSGNGSNLPPPTCTPLTVCPSGYTCGEYPNGCGTGNINCGGCDGGLSCIDGQCTGCVPLTACPASQTCGEWPDGCGNVLQCGSCPSGESCIGGACTSGCTPETCSSQHVTCGQAGNGCGGVIDGGCGSCPAGESCEATDAGTLCVSAPCTTVSCATLGLHCGQAGNGCGGTQDCGDCTPPETCGGGGVTGVCGQADADLCVPLTCGSQNIQCGPAGDGCGNLITTCGTCGPGTTCGGGGSPGICGAPNCNPLTCAVLNLHCGQTGDGCGGILNCGDCVAPATCGGGGTTGVCGEGDANACTPLTCAEQNIQCGSAGDGCGNLLTCPPCPSPETCGGGGVPGVCGSPVCSPLTCTGLGLQCGTTGDGCGGTLDCGDCTPPLTCGGGGTTGVCGEADANVCQPFTCGTVACGEIGDGCGGTINCGDCAPPQSCGGGGTAGVCGSPSCTAKTCTELGATCGVVADGCGGVTANCGTCNGSTTCGGGGTPNQCGSPNCTPTTCQLAGANCGPVADGCGGIIQCGTCTAPDTCGGGGVASVCGTSSTK